MSNMANLIADYFFGKKNVYATTFCLLGSKQVSGQKLRRKINSQKGSKEFKIIKEKRGMFSKVVLSSALFFQQIFDMGNYICAPIIIAVA